MNEPQLDQKIRQGATRAKKDLNNLKEDGIDKLNELNEDSNYSTDDVEGMVNSGVAQLNNEFEKVKSDATKTVAKAATTVMKNVGNGLSQFNAKAAEAAKKLPGDVGAKAGEYPWVAISFALMAGFLLRGFLLPVRD